MMTVSQAAHMLGVDRSTVRRWVQRGQIPAQKWGSVYYINPDDLRVVPAHKSARECAAAAIAALDGLLDSGCTPAELAALLDDVTYCVQLIKGQPAKHRELIAKLQQSLER
jgi:excisionase family DNA binding protein